MATADGAPGGSNRTGAASTASTAGLSETDPSGRGGVAGPSAGADSSEVPVNRPAITAPPLVADEPSPAETYGLAWGALGAAVMTLGFDDHGLLTILMLAVALVPWALVAGGVRVPTWLFATLALVPAGVVVATAEAGAPIFLGLLALTRVFSATPRWSVRWATMAATLVLPFVLVVAEDGGKMSWRTFDDHGAHYFAAGAVVCALAGDQSHRQRELTAKLRWSLSQLDAAAAAEERRRVARDVHDVVAHSLTVVLLNVTGARKALATHPELAAEALERAETVGRESLDGVRRVVGLLRSGDEPAAGAPQPTAGDLPTVVEQQRQAGADVDLEVTGDLETLEPLAGGTVVRLVQEAVTNAQRHAPGAPIRVSIAVAPDRLTATVHNGPPQRPPLDVDGARQGLGLLGMRERVEALHGHFTAGPAGDGWTVTAEIPIAPAPGSASVSDQASTSSPVSAVAAGSAGTASRSDRPTPAGGAS